MSTQNWRLSRTLTRETVAVDVDNWMDRLFMMTSSNGNIFRVTGPLCGEFTGPGELLAQRPETRSFGVFFDLRPNKRSSKQPWGWWFETPSWSLWRQCNVLWIIMDCHCFNSWSVHRSVCESWSVLILIHCDDTRLHFRKFGNWL